MRGTSGRVSTFTGTSTAYITSAVVIWARMTAVGITARGNQTFLISSPFDTMLAVPNTTPPWKNVHVARPVRMNCG